jgi:hypothetical protein
MQKTGSQHGNASIKRKPSLLFFKDKPEVVNGVYRSRRKEVVLRKEIVFMSGITLVVVAVTFLGWKQSELHSVEVASKTISLPAPKTDGATSVEKALRERRSIREFKRQPLSVAEVSQLLWSG